MVYFIQEEGTNFVKIGYSKTKEGVDERLKSLQTGNARKLSLLFLFNGSIDDEKDLHKAFKKQRVLGEWFNIKDKLQDFDIKDRIETYLEKRIQKREQEADKIVKQTEKDFKYIESSIIKYAKNNKDRKVDYYELIKSIKPRIKNDEYWSRYIVHIFSLVYPDKFKSEIPWFNILNFDLSKCINTIKHQEEKEKEYIRSLDKNKEVVLKTNMSEFVSIVENKVLDSIKNGVTKKSEICKEQRLNINNVNFVWKNPRIQSALNIIHK